MLFQDDLSVGLSLGFQKYREGLKNPELGSTSLESSHKTVLGDSILGFVSALPALPYRWLNLYGWMDFKI